MGQIISIRNSSILAGSTTTSISLATGLSYWALKKILLINLTDNKDLEKYLKKFDFKFSLDYIDTFHDDYNDKYKIAVSSVSDKLDILGGFNDYGNIEIKKNTLIQMLTAIKHNYDFIILDASNNQDETILDIVDKDIVMFKPSILENVNTDLNLSEKSIIIFNGIYDKMKPLIMEKCESYFPGCKMFLIDNDADVFYQTNLGFNLYEYLINNMKSTDIYVNDILEICFDLLELESITDINKRKWGLSEKFNRYRKII